MDITKLTGIERQDAFIKSIAGQDFDFGLVMTQAFLKGIRDIGYKSTATAIFESIDNSIQAEASNIYIIFDGKPGKNPERIAIIDDGYGMSQDMIRVAVLWGGSDRLDDRQGMGKYGYGLPSSCVSIGESFTVISKREDTKDWSGVTIDLKKIAERDPEYVDANSKRIVAPAAKPTELPAFVQQYLTNKNITLATGTIILIDKIDRLSKNSLGSLKSFLLRETGVTYRNFLRNVNIYIDGTPLLPIDPLFTTEGYQYYDELDILAEPLPSLEIKVENQFDPKKIGTIKVRYSYMPYGFFGPIEGKANKNGAEQEEDEDEKKSKTKRLTVRRHNNGILFLRRARQIDVIDSKCPWTKFQTNDRYVGVEIDFSPELDEEFSITTSKQQIVASQRLWDILKENGVYEAISTMRRRYEKQSKIANDLKKKAAAATQEETDTFTETVMEQSAKSFEVDTDAQPQHVKQEGKDNLKKKAKQIAEETGMAEEAVEQQLEQQTVGKPYKIDYIDEEEGPFYRTSQFGSQIVVYINKAHRFYTDLFNSPETNSFTKNALALLIFVLSHSELRVTDEKRKWYKIERNAWSLKLDEALETLSQYFEKSKDDDAMEHELTEAAQLQNKD